MKSLLTEPLGLYGWASLEPVLLAALASEDPLLLVGPHGCAKSFVLERLAESLGLEFRSYNASLLNYDDLVGIPMPDESRASLRYVSTPESIWDAQVVFVDEINRTRPDLQNKLFPIVHDRRVQGRTLERLRYRWAAMNPPPDEDADDAPAGAAGADYLGAEPLDPALADRFPFVAAVPDWEALSEDERRAVLADQFRGRHEFPVPVGALVAEAKAAFERAKSELAPALEPYVLELVPQLRAAGFDVSTRRATMLHRGALAVHAARVALARRAGAEAPDLYASALLALRCGLPDRARRPVPDVRVAALCRQAWDLSQAARGGAEWTVMREPDPRRRLEAAVPRQAELSAERLASLVCDGVAAAPAPRRRALALAAYLALRARADLPASAMETLATEIAPAMEPGESETAVTMSKAGIAREVESRRAAVDARFAAPTAFELRHHHANLLRSFLPGGYRSHGEVRELSDEFVRLWKKFALPC
ncbi:MAG: AAA family ATPase [Kiritimatiellae bacterium]|nr:AAA family ATPase [Kiritimatiellia bacterium]